MPVSVGRLRVVIAFLFVALIATAFINFKAPPVLAPDRTPEPKTPTPIPVRAPQALEPAGPSAEILARGKAVFQAQCAICHGDDGKGKSPAAAWLNPKARDLTVGSFRLVSNLDGIVDSGDIFRTVSRGMPGSSMPSYELLPESDRWAVSHYVKSLSKPDRRQLRLVAPGAEPRISAPSILRGRRIFTMSCAVCHGPEGRGNAAIELRDSDGTLTHARDLGRGIFKGGRDAAQIYCRVAAGMPGSPMPSQSSALEPAMIWDVAHFVQSLSNPVLDERNLQKLKPLVVPAISQKNLDDPRGDAWAGVPGTILSLMPLTWSDERAEILEVRAAHDGSDLFVRIVFAATLPKNMVSVQSAADGVALKLAQCPAGELPPPLFMYALNTNDPCVWKWSSEEQASRNDAERVSVTAVCQAGMNIVVFRRALQPGGQGIEVKPGSNLLFALSCWNRDSAEQPIQENVTIWQRLQIEK